MMIVVLNETISFDLKNNVWVNFTYLCFPFLLCFEKGSTQKDGNPHELILFTHRLNNDDWKVGQVSPPGTWHRSSNQCFFFVFVRDVIFIKFLFVCPPNIEIAKEFFFFSL
jgi:hypothetical protein